MSIKQIITSSIADGAITDAKLSESLAANISGFITTNNLTTANVTEVDNLYYTDARAFSNATAAGFATETYVGEQIAALVDSSPATLDTLNELAAALGNDNNFATTTATLIGQSYDQANASYDQANIAITTGQAAFDSSNIVYTVAIGAFDNSNTAFTTATNAFNGANLAYTTATTAFDSSNAVYTVATGAFNGANLAYTTATDAFVAANTASVIAESAFDQANIANGTAEQAFAVANAAVVAADLTTANVAEVDNLYYTDARVYANVVTGNFATQSYVNSEVANLIASAPETLDTLNELAAALGDDPNFATTTATLIGISYNQANSAFAAANVANGTAEQAFAVANAAVVAADLTTANVTEDTNLYYTDDRVYSNVTQLGYITASSLSGYATNSQLTDYATVADVGVVFNTANTAQSTAEAAFDAANAAGSSDTVTAAFDKANTAYTVATTAYDEANTRVQTVAGVTSTTISNAQIAAGISSTTLSNLTLSGNVETAGYVLGDGSQLSNISGGISYVYKTANYTATNKQGVLADTAGGAFTVTLPASPEEGYQVVIADPTSSWATNSLTIGRNGSTIADVAEDLVCDLSGVSVQLVYNGSTWVVFSQAGGSTGSAGIKYILKTSNYTAQVNEGILADTSAGSFTVTLPADPSSGAQVVVVDPKGTWSANNVYIARNGSTIGGVDEDLAGDLDDTSIQFIYSGTTWIIYAQAGGISAYPVTAVAGVTSNTVSNAQIAAGISSTTIPNITLSGNVETAGYFLGDGSQLSNISGGLSYITKTANYTASNNEGVLADTSGGSFTVTLPADPVEGDQVVVADAGGTWETNNLTVGRNGSTINGASEDLICNINGISVQFVYDGTTWAVYSQAGGVTGSPTTDIVAEATNLYFTNARTYSNVTAITSLPDLDVDWSKITSKPDPVITLTLTGDVSGTSSATLADLASNTITTSVTISNQSGNAGKYLTTDGTITSWSTVEAGFNPFLLAGM